MHGSLLSKVNSWADIEVFRRHEEKILFLFTLIIGGVVGLVVVAFILVTEKLGARLLPPGGAGWRRLILPVAGSLASAYLLYRYFPFSRGSGISQIKTAYYIQSGIIRFRAVLGKFVCSSISLASGIALGPEGPAIYVGAGIASVLGRRLGLSQERVRQLVPIGAAAALATAFNTPIAAVLFTLEEVLADLHAPVLGSIILSSATAWMVLHLLLGDEPLMHVPAYQLVHPIELAFYAVLGIAGGLVSVSFSKLLLWQRKRFLRLPGFTKPWQPLIGGVLVGAMGWFVPGVMGVGYSYVGQALNGQMLLQTMALLVGLKVLATATCYACGNAGGIFAPSLFIGAMLGGTVGAAAHMIAPDYTGSAGAFALVGMGTAFAGIIRAPLTSIIMIFEITRDYSIIAPLMVSNLISYFISTQMQKEPIFEALQHQDGVFLPTGARDRRDVLVVGRGLRPAAEVLGASESIHDAAVRLTGEQDAWPVTDRGGLLGMVTVAQLREAVEKGRGDEPVRALLEPVVRFGRAPFPHVHADHPLDTAMRRMAQSGLTILPVVSRLNLRELRGLISLHDIMTAYGLEKDHDTATVSEVARTEPEPRARMLLGVVLVLAAALVVAVLLSYFYQRDRASRAGEYFKRGTELEQSERYHEAIEQFRNALSITHSDAARLALTQALVRADRLNEAEIYARELLQNNPASGPAHRELGRIDARRGDMRNALAEYHRAIYGSWPNNARENRFETRMELIRELARVGNRKQVQNELLTLLPEVPPDAALQKQVAQLLLDFGLSQQAADLYHDVLQQHAVDPGAYAGLAEAELARNRFVAARQAFEQAAHLSPDNQTYAQRLQLTEHVISLDPALRGLPPFERYRRSRSLLQAALGAYDECAAGRSKQPAAEVVALADAARKRLLDRRPVRSYADASETNMNEAVQLWQIRVTVCGAPAPSEEALSRAIAAVTR